MLNRLTRSYSATRLIAFLLCLAFAAVGCRMAPTATPPPTASPTPVPSATPTATPQPRATISAGLGFSIYFIDVEQGDATLIQASGGETLLIDGGRSVSRIRDRFQRLGSADLDAILATHPDADHIAGLTEALELYPIERVYLNGSESDTQTYRGMMEAIQDENSTVITLRRGDTIQLGPLVLQALHPAELTGDSNPDSIVLLLDCGEVEVLLMGDAEIESEHSIIEAGLLYDIDVLKVGHHGSSTSTSAEFMEIVKPETAVISAGRDNSYGHPHREVVALLNEYQTEIIYTDTSTQDNTVVMTSDCHTYDFDLAHE